MGANEVSGNLVKFPETPKQCGLSINIVGMYDKWKCNRGKPREKKEGSKILQKIKNKLKKN